MDGDLLSCLQCFFRHSLILLLLHDVEANGCSRVIHKMVGEHVELPVCTASGGLTYARWSFNDSTIKEWHSSEGRPHQATEVPGTVMSSTNFSLLIGSVTVGNSGTYQFLSAAKDQQHPQITITLRVDEVPVRPVMWLNSTWHDSNSSCSVWLECRGLHQKGVSFSWTIRGQNYTGTKVFIPLRLQEEIDATCTTSGTSRNGSTSKPVTCVRTPAVILPGPPLLYVIGGVAGAAVVCLVPVVICAFRHRKRKYRGADTEEIDATIYADVTNAAGPRDVTPNDPNPNPINPPTIYETINEQCQIYTVYDKIHFTC